jgi:hypothetical protein
MNGYGTKPSQLKDSMDYVARRWDNVNPVNYYTLYVDLLDRKPYQPCVYRTIYTLRTTRDYIEISKYVSERTVFRVPPSRICDNFLKDTIIPRKLGYTFYYTRKWRREY